MQYKPLIVKAKEIEEIVFDNSKYKATLYDEITSEGMIEYRYNFVIISRRLVAF